MFDFLKIYMASEFMGKLLDDGKPLSGIKVTRRVEDSKPIYQTATTDKSGIFKFEAVTAHSPSKLLPFEMRFTQEITIDGDSGPVTLFYFVKSNKVEGGEFGEIDDNYNISPSKMNFSCDLIMPDEVIEEGSKTYQGICRMIK